MINVFLLTDVEGIAGVDSITQMDRTSPEYENTRKLLSDSINKAVSACFEANADKVYYLDGHGGGGNVFEDLIDPRAQKCSLQEWVELLKSGSIDCQIELGAHAKAGTINGFLDHTISSKTIFSIKINGIEMCETSLHAALCGKFGVSVIAVIGDEAICRQVKDYIPACFTCAVKMRPSETSQPPILMPTKKCAIPLLQLSPIINQCRLIRLASLSRLRRLTIVPIFVNPLCGRRLLHLNVLTQEL